jgi:hypothetical protein
VNVPSSLVVAVRGVGSVWPVTVTVAFCTAAPVASVTVPAMEPVVERSCAKAEAAHMHSTTTS